MAVRAPLASSTVVDCTGDDVIILRPGMLGRESLEAVLAPLGIILRHAVRTIAHDTPAQAPHAETPRSPGMADRHYAPRADVWLFDTHQRDEIARSLHQWQQTRREAGQSASPVHALLRGGPLVDRDGALATGTRYVPMPSSPVEYARALYGALHAADDDSVGLVLIEAPPNDAAWDGVRDRLTRAAR